MENQKGSNLLGGIAVTKIIDLSVKEKIYKSKKAQISILNDFRLEVAAGEKIAIVGRAGICGMKHSISGRSEFPKVLRN